MRWRNWDGRIRCQPAVYAAPRSEHELRRIMRQWSSEGRRVRVAGSGHSFTPLVESADALLWLGRLSGLHSVDAAAGTVTVWAGTTLRRLGRLLAAQGLAQENLGDIDAQSIAGAIATGTHGTGAALPPLAAQVQGLTLITAAGECMDIDAQRDPDLLDAARVSLGALGVISRVRLQVMPAYRLHLRVRRGTLEECLERGDDYADQHRHFEFYWFPWSPVTQLKFTDVTGAAAQPRPWWNRAADEVLENGVFYVASEVCRRVPRWSPALSRLAARTVATGEAVDASARIFATARRVRFHEMEYALPRAELAPALREIRRRIERAGYQVHFPLECRYSAADTAWLSPAAGRDSAYIAVHMYRGMPFEAYFRDLEAVLRAHGGRPHWGKWHTPDPALYAAQYAHWHDFLRTRARLDPDNRMLNPWLRRELGDA